MKEINKNELLRALEAVKPGLASSEIIEQSTSFAFLKNKVVTYNDEISVSYPVTNLNLTGAVKAEDLYSLVSKLRNETLTMEVVDNEVRIVSGRSKAGLRLEEKVKLPLDEIDPVEDFKTLPEDFIDNLVIAMSCAAKTISEPILRCVHITPEGIFESSDRYRLLKIKGTKIPIEESFLIPAKEAETVVKFIPTKIAVTSNWIHFTKENGALLSCRLVHEKFPSLVELLEFDGVTFDLPKNINSLLDRASVFTKRPAYIEESVLIKISAKNFKIRSENQTAWYEESTKTEYDGEEMIFGISPYLLKFVIDKQKSCIKEDNKIKVEGDNWTYVAVLKTINE